MFHRFIKSKLAEKEPPSEGCVGHEPKWRDVGHLTRKPNPAFFGLKKTNWGKRCSHCEAPRTRYKLVQLQVCVECDCTREVVIFDDDASCLCAGSSDFEHSLFV